MPDVPSKSLNHSGDQSRNGCRHRFEGDTDDEIQCARLSAEGCLMGADCCMGQSSGFFGPFVHCSDACPRVGRCLEGKEGRGRKGGRREQVWGHGMMMLVTCIQIFGKLSSYRTLLAQPWASSVQGSTSGSGPSGVMAFGLMSP